MAPFDSQARSGQAVDSARNTATAQRTESPIDEQPVTAVRTTAGTISQDIAVASKLADLAVSRAWSAKDVEKGIPAEYELANAVLIRVLHPNTGIDVDACRQCPLDAYRRQHEYGPGTCLRPDHYDELRAEAERRRQQAVAQLTAPPPLVQDDTASEAAPPLTSLRDLDYNAIRVIRSDPPTGCTGGCPCRAIVMGHDGKPTPICTSLKRFDQLTAAQKRADAKARRDQYKVLAGQLDARLEQLATFGRKELAILGAEMATGVGAAVLRAAVKRWLPELPEDQSRPLSTVTREQLMSAHPHELLRFCLALKFGDELARNLEYGYAPNRCDVAHWFLADDTPRTQTPFIDESG